jgi:RNA polymerase sigma-70 factor (ECF subfamily)
MKYDKLMPVAELLDGSIRGCHKMQTMLYEQFAPKMYSVCLRYAGNTEDAEDILQEGFIKVFKNLNKFRGDGSFEGWIRTIITRTALSHLNENAKRHHIVTTELIHSLKDREPDVIDKLAEKDIIGMVKQLTPGYRKVFMLYVIEGYSHKEIAAVLNCSEGNSKSQLFRSRIQLLKKLRKTA